MVESQLDIIKDEKRYYKVGYVFQHHDYANKVDKDMPMQQNRFRFLHDVEHDRLISFSLEIIT